MIPEGLDPALYFITDTALCGGPERVPHVVYEAVAGGAGIVQVRDKHADDAAFLALARACRDAVRRAEDALGRTAALVVNDRVGVAERLGLHVHVGQSDASLAVARRAPPWRWPAGPWARSGWWAYPPPPRRRCAPRRSPGWRTWWG